MIFSKGILQDAPSFARLKVAILGKTLVESESSWSNRAENLSAMDPAEDVTLATCWSVSRLSKSGCADR